MTLQHPTPKKRGGNSVTTETEAPPVRRKRRLPRWHKVFLEALRNTGNVTLAADTAGVHRNTVYAAKHANEDFAMSWEAALDVAGATMEGEARRRAMEGVLEPVYYRGEAVGAIRKFSDTLLIFLLKAHNPKKYRDYGREVQNSSTSDRC